MCYVLCVIDLTTDQLIWWWGCGLIVPAKPTLFDLAFNGVSYPNIDARIKAAPKPTAAAPAPAASKSFLGRLFGR